MRTEGVDWTLALIGAALGGVVPLAERYQRRARRWLREGSPGAS